EISHAGVSYTGSPHKTLLLSHTDPTPPFDQGTLTAVLLLGGHSLMPQLKGFHPAEATHTSAGTGTYIIAFQSIEAIYCPNALSVHAHPL
ncbi:hypothetical protein AVEN_85753-1, partial [Araneus ventricosus]